MSQNLIDALDICLSALENGADLDSCLELYPELAGELRPLLETAQAANPPHRQVTLPLPAMKRSRTALLARAGELRSSRRNWLGLSQKLSLALIPLVLVLILILSSRGLYVASAQALPGDRLYSVKRAVEQIRLQFTSGGSKKSLIEASYSLKRIDEIELLLGLGRTQKVSFEGILEEMGERRWTISGIPVVITPETVLIGDFQIRDIVKVEGETRPEGWVQAHEIRQFRMSFDGLVENISSDAWTVAGKLLEINAESQLDPSIQVGDMAQVMAWVEDDGHLVALAILRLPDESVSQPEATPAPTPSLSPEPGPEPSLESTEESDEDSEQDEITGIVEAIQDGYWIIAGLTVYISDSTEINDTIQVGDLVKLNVLSQADGSWLAVKIELDKSGSGGDDDDASETPEGEEDQSSEAPEDDDSSANETPEADDDDPSETPKGDDETEEPPNETPTPSP